MATTKVQRIKLRCEGSPVKYDGVILKSTQDGKRVEVEFDAPTMETRWFYACGDRRLASDMVDRDGKPVEEYRLAAKTLLWEVL